MMSATLGTGSGSDLESRSDPLLQFRVERLDLRARRRRIDRLGRGESFGGAQRLLRRGAGRIGGDGRLQLGQRVRAHAGLVVPAWEDAFLLPPLERVDAAERLVGCGDAGSDPDFGSDPATAISSAAIALFASR